MGFSNNLKFPDQIGNNDEKKREKSKNTFRNLRAQ